MAQVDTGYYDTVRVYYNNHVDSKLWLIDDGTLRNRRAFANIFIVPPFPEHHFGHNQKLREAAAQGKRHGKVMAAAWVEYRHVYVSIDGDGDLFLSSRSPSGSDKSLDKRSYRGSRTRN